MTNRHPLFRLAMLAGILCATVGTNFAGPEELFELPQVVTSGRVEFDAAGHAQLGYSGTRVRFAFEGTGATVRMRSVGGRNWIQVFVNGVRHEKLEVPNHWSTLRLDGAATEILQRVELVKATEGAEGIVEIADIKLADGGALQPWTPLESRRIEFIGDSITCGYGIEAADAHASWHASTQHFCDTYAWLTARALEADYLVVARSGIGMVRNYDGPHQGSEAALPSLYGQSFFHRSEPPWDPSRFTPDVVCINLGTNDFSTTGVDEGAFEAAYLSFVQRLLEQYPEPTRIVCLLGPMLNDSAVKTVLERIVKRANEACFNPRVFHFEMAAQGELGYGADWHPSKAQAQLNARELTAYLRGLMHW